VLNVVVDFKHRGTEGAEKKSRNSSDTFNIAKKLNAKTLMDDMDGIDDMDMEKIQKRMSIPSMSSITYRPRRPGYLFLRSQGVPPCVLQRKVSKVKCYFSNYGITSKV